MCPGPDLSPEPRVNQPSSCLSWPFIAIALPLSSCYRQDWLTYYKSGDDENPSISKTDLCTQCITLYISRRSTLHRPVSASDELVGFMLMPSWFVTWNFYSIFTTPLCLLQLWAFRSILMAHKNCKILMGNDNSEVRIIPKFKIHNILKLSQV